MMARGLTTHKTGGLSLRMQTDDPLILVSLNHLTGATEVTGLIMKKEGAVFPL